MSAASMPRASMWCRSSIFLPTGGHRAEGLWRPSRRVSSSSSTAPAGGPESAPVLFQSYTSVLSPPSASPRELSVSGFARARARIGMRRRPGLLFIWSPLTRLLPTVSRPTGRSVGPDALHDRSLGAGRSIQSLHHLSSSNARRAGGTNRRARPSNPTRASALLARMHHRDDEAGGLTSRSRRASLYSRDIRKADPCKPERSGSAQTGAARGRAGRHGTPARQPLSLVRRLLLPAAPRVLPLPDREARDGAALAARHGLHLHGHPSGRTRLRGALRARVRRSPRGSPRARSDRRRGAGGGTNRHGGRALARAVRRGRPRAGADRLPLPPGSGGAAVSDVYVIGVGMTPFGKHPERNATDLGADAALAAIHDAGIEPRQIEAAYCGHVFQGMAMGQRVLAHIGLAGIPLTNVENVCSSGAVAIREASLAIRAGEHGVVLAFGTEHLTSRFRGALTPDPDDVEAAVGLTMPGIYALRARRYFEDYGVSREQLALVPVKNKRNAALNPFAQFQEPVTVEQVLESRQIAEPLHLLDCSPVTDGAAAAILAGAGAARRLGQHGASPPP